MPPSGSRSLRRTSPKCSRKHFVGMTRDERIPVVAGSHAHGRGKGPLLARLAVRRPVHGGLRARLPGAVAYSIYLSLFRTRLIGGTAFVGLDNYTQALRTRSSGRRSAGSRLFLVVQVPVMLFLALLVALAIDSGRLYGPAFFRISIFLPYAVPAVVATLMWGFMYGTQFGLVGEHQRRASASRCPTRCRPTWILASIGNIVTWEFVGYNMLIFYSALRVDPRELYEAAEIDGAGQLRIIRAIKLPGPARRPGHRHDLLDHRQLPALQRAEHPAHAGAERDHHLLHARTCTPTTLSFAGQQYNYSATVAIVMGVITDGHRLRRAAPRHAEGELSRAIDASAAVRRSAHRAAAPAAHRAAAARRCTVAHRCSCWSIYSLLPLAWLVINATKTQERAARLLRPVVRPATSRCSTTSADAHLPRRDLPPLAAATPCCTWSSARAARPCWPRSPGTGWRSSSSPGKRAVFAVVHRRGRGARHRAGRADVPDVQPAWASPTPRGRSSSRR